MLILEYWNGIEQCKIIFSALQYLMMAEMSRASALDSIRRLKTPMDSSCVGNTNPRRFFPVPPKRHFPKFLGNTLVYYIREL